MNQIRKDFLCSMLMNTLECGLENSPKKQVDTSFSLLFAFEARIRQDQKEKCVMAIQGDVGDDLFLIQRIMGAD